MLERRHEDHPAPSRAPWVVPLAFGVGGTLALVFMILVGIGYDLLGRTPGPIVITGLALLSAPMLYIARTNFRDYQGRRDVHELIGQFSPEMLVALSEACRRHGASNVEDIMFPQLRQLNRTGSRRAITAKVIQIEGEIHDEP